MTADAPTRKTVLRKLKAGELTAAEAMELLLAAAPMASTASEAPAELPAELPSGRLRERLEAKLVEIVAAEAKIPAARIQPREPLERYGFDSVMALEVVRVLERDFGRLSPTLLFEHQTVAELAAHLAEEHREKALGMVGASATASPPVRAAAPAPSPAPPPAPVPSRAAERRPEAEPIAIVGLSCRFPQAEDLEAFWENLAAGRDSITEIPPERWDHRRYFDPEPGHPGKSYSKWGGFIADADKFDAAFFHISPREAERMDPQERLFLEEVWHALEDAALTRQRLAGRDVGVYVGVMYSQYQLFAAEEALAGNPLYLGNSYASIANRVSYFFDFHGPSLALDTMCSSSLTAIHLAIEALRGGDIEVAVAGGVNLTIHPNKYLDLSQGRFAASDGRCRSFGSGGDGYVPGEGVGVVVLKPLSAALADGDRVHALLRGSALNHGGKTNGYSVPNPKAQSRLIRKAMARAGVSPREVSYLEAHGTGTSLGDPIEITALTQAFRAGTKNDPEETRSCAIGSVKSNVGHLESAAGVAGLAKVVLQMRHRQLAPSLHSETLNPHIDFETTPFRVQRSLEPWIAPRRIAGISSFGAGGSNAHLVVEEHAAPEPPLPAAAEAGPHLILLSAASEERLRALAGALARHLERSEHDDVPEGRLLARLAFTLQTGREALDERLAVWTDGRRRLVETLAVFAGGGEAEGVLRGTAEASQADLTLLLAGEAGEAFLRHLRDSRDLERLARLWLRGIDIDWRRLTPEPHPRPLSLPGYPFARERHWPELTERSRLERPRAGEPAAAALHPLVEENVSTLHEQRFETTFDGREPFLSDHQVDGRCLLPAAALLEMARAAGALSGLGDLPAVEDTVWEAPVAVAPGHPVRLSISLLPEAGRVAYRVWSEPEPGRREIHAHGRLTAAGEEVPGTEKVPGTGTSGGDRLDLDALTAALGETLDGERCYRRLAARGLVYGPSLRALETVHRGDGQALGRLRLPPSAGDRVAWVLPPALLDGAFQTLAALAEDGPADTGQLPVQVPFAAERLEVFAPLPERCWVHAVRRSGDRYDFTLADPSGRVVARLSGLAVRSLPRSAKALAPDAETPAGAETLVLRSEWQPAVDAAAAELPARVLVFEDSEAPGTPLADLLHSALEHRAAEVRDEGATVEVLRVRPGRGFTELGPGLWEIEPGDLEAYRQLVEQVWPAAEAGDKDAGAKDTGAATPGTAIVHAWSRRPEAGSGETVETEETLEAALERGFYSLLGLTRALVERRPAGRLALITAHPAAGGLADPAFAALGAFHRTVATESPGFVFTTLEVPAGDDGGCRWDEQTAALLLDELACSAGARRGGEEVRWEAGVRQARRLVEVPRSAGLSEGPAEGSASSSPPWRSGGVYLLTGGLGGLGRALARHLASRWQARLVLSGRSPLDAGGKALLAELESAGGRAVYVQADCAQRDDVGRLVEEARERFGGLHGVLHLAGTLRDGFLLRKRREDAEAVLAAKVWGALHLDEATREEDLDFFALFSSASSVMGVAGQSDYAFANAFLDQFARRRQARRQEGRRRGATVSVAWPLWQGGGMGVDEAAQAWIEENFGWQPLPVAEGLRVLDAALTAPDAAWAVFHGHREKILAALGSAAETPAREPAVAAAPAETRTTEAVGEPQAIEVALAAHLRKLLAAELKLAEEKLDPRRRFEHLGLESVMVMNMTRELEKDLGELPKTLFFEHASLAELTRYLVTHHRAAVAERFRPEPAAASAGAAPPEVPAAQDGPPPSGSRFLAAPAVQTPRRAPSPREPAAAETTAGEPIAIVGVAGRYPLADDLGELWANLRQGRDCIREVPQERWDHRRWFDPAGGPGTSYSKWGGFLDGVDRFDPLFFNISPREARSMDPQERLFLETAWQTLEDAGIRRDRLAGRRVGVFVGVMYAQYQLYGAQPEMQRRGFVPTSLSAAVANRVSYLLDFHGPSLALDTMCSSSLTALHLACAALRQGDCEAALAGGVNTIVHPNRYLQLSQSQFASSDGRCRSFGEGGDGYVPGEGVGAVLLKPLGRALADGDRIYALVRGTAVNHGGRTNGFTVPAPAAQGAVIQRALEASGVDPRDIGYIEAHGTGTSLGDPIEIAGLARAFEAAGAVLPPASCPIGSIKSNLGHLESAAGIAGVTKVLLQMRHGELVPSLHAETLNPNIRFEESPFAVQRTLAPWRPREEGGAARPRLAAVSSFGAGGSNAHVLLEEWLPPADAAEPAAVLPARELVVLSAKTEAQLAAYAAAVAGRIDPGTAPGGARPAVDGERLEARLSPLRSAAAEILGVGAEDIDPDEDLETLGFDTLALERLAERIAGDTGAAFDPRTLTEHRTLRSVAERLAREAEPAAAAAGGLRLRDVAHTLRVGREGFEERLAVVVSSLAELAGVLRRFAAGETAAGEIHRGRVPAADLEASPAETPADPPASADLADLDALARRWVRREAVETALERLGAGARRVSLPTYPFARVRCWVPEAEEAQEAQEAQESPEAAAAQPAPEVHPVHPTPEPRHSSSATPPAAPPAASPAPPSEATWERARSTIVEAMAAVLEIGVSEFDPDLPHSDFGVDSVLAVEIVDRINEALEIDLKPTDFFNYSTIRKLAGYVAGLMPPEATAPAAQPTAQPTMQPAVQPAAQPTAQPAVPPTVQPTVQSTAHTTAHTTVQPAAPPPGVAPPPGGNGHTHLEPGDALLELLQRLERGEISALEADRLLGS